MPTPINAMTTTAPHTIPTIATTEDFSEDAGDAGDAGDADGVGSLPTVYETEMTLL
jgi:hypothetical protein